MEHGHTSSFRQGDIPADGDEMHRSMTRGSHNSHASANASTRSWVTSNQMNPHPHPVERSSSVGQTPFYGPRPLPDPHSVRRTPVRNPPPAIEDDEGGDDPPIGSSSLTMQGGQQPEVLSEGEDNNLPPSSLANTRSKRGGRSLIGGFMSGLMRLPSVLRIGGGQKSKRRLARKGTFGTDGTSSPATGMTRGNTLPRYLSNPSIGPSNPQFAHRLSVANGALPPDASPSSFHNRPHPHPNSSLQPNGNPSPPPLLNRSFERHPEPSRPNFPTIIRVTPPSANEAIIEEELSDIYDDPPEHHPQFESHAPPNPNHNLNDTRATVMVWPTEHHSQFESHAPSNPNSDLNDTRATVMVYNNSDDSHESHPTITPPIQPVHVQRVSYAYQPSPRTSNRIRDEPPPLPTNSMSIVSPPMSLALPRGVSSVDGPKDSLSPQTSRYTTTTMASHYDPSFASHLTPIEKFFKGLYNLPWVARERVTIDYRPGDSNRAKIKVKGGVKRPMASWYRAVVSRSRRASRDLDLLSNGTGSVSASTSLGNSLTTPLASPTSRRSGRSSNNNRYQTSHKNHRHRKKRRRGTTLTDPPQRNASPLLPGVYPYPTPPYPYTYPYGSYPTAPMHVPVSHTAPQPRGRHVPKYPYGYAPYQPMPQQPPTAPMYFIAPSPPPNNEGQGNGNMTGQQAMAQGPVQISPVMMGYIPGGFNQDPTLASPPITPRRTAAPQS